MNTRSKGTTQLKDLLSNHRPKVLPCITLILGGKRVKVAWIYVNCPWCAHDLSQFGIKLGPFSLETITYCFYRSVLHSVLIGAYGGWLCLAWVE